MGLTMYHMDRYNATLHQAHEAYRQGGMKPFNFTMEDLTVTHAILIAVGSCRWNQVLEQIFLGMPPPFHKDPIDGHYRIGQPLPIMTSYQQVRYSQVYWNLKPLIWARLTREEQHLVQGVAMGASTVSQLFLYPVLNPGPVGLPPPRPADSAASMPRSHSSGSIQAAAKKNRNYQQEISRRRKRNRSSKQSLAEYNSS